MFSLTSDGMILLRIGLLVALLKPGICQTPPWGKWESWSSCSKSCGSGVKTRVRGCLKPGWTCEQSEQASCNLGRCGGSSPSANGGLVFDGWGQWSECSVTCGRGETTRIRYCAPNSHGRGCGQEEIKRCDIRDCSSSERPRIPPWLEWEPWSVCSATCGWGNRRRIRTCLKTGDVKYSNCQEWGEESCRNRECSSSRRPHTPTTPFVSVSESDLTLWTSWTACSKTCGAGVEKRWKVCRSANGGRGSLQFCPGHAPDEQYCNLAECPSAVVLPTEPSWTEWGEWSDCSTTCGTGVINRSRRCDGGRRWGGTFAYCPGDASEQKICKLSECSEWGEWTEWSACSKTCGIGRETRTRKCIGRQFTCVGKSTANRRCSAVSCPKVRWSEWSTWGECSASCGGGSRTRSRECARRRKISVVCPGDSFENENCNEKECEQECGQAGDVEFFNQRARVIGGSNSKEGDWPWQAMITLNYDYVANESLRILHGAASLINSKWLLSAAHVFDRFDTNIETRNWTNSILVILGANRIPDDGQLSTNARIVEPAYVVKHPKYDVPSSDNDAALIRVGRTFRISGSMLRPFGQAGTISPTPYIRPVCLPCISDANNLRNQASKEKFSVIACYKIGKSFKNEDSKVVVTGYGERKDGTPHKETGVFTFGRLQHGRTLIAADDKCEAGAKKIREYLSRTRYTSNMICTLSDNLSNPVDACQGDSGGPLVKSVKQSSGEEYWMQIGVVSWGWGCAHTDTNGTRYPGYFTSVTSVMPFVVDVMTTYT